MANKLLDTPFCFLRHKYLAESKKDTTFVPGKMAEWSIAAVLKTVELRGSGGSNPSLSAQKKAMIFFIAFLFSLEREVFVQSVAVWQTYLRGAVLLRN